MRKAQGQHTKDVACCGMVEEIGARTGRQDKRQEEATAAKHDLQSERSLKALAGEGRAANRAALTIPTSLNWYKKPMMMVAKPTTP